MPALPMPSREPETLRMNFQNRTLRWASLPERIRGMFNLNDPRWGRGDDNKADDGARPEERPAAPPPARYEERWCGRGADRWDCLCDLDGNRVFYCSGRSAGGHYPVREVQKHRGCRF